MNSFSPDVALQLKYYVYLLVDPRTDEIFYVGKGTSDRVFQHEKAFDGSEKSLKVRDIQKNGYSVKKYIVHSGMSEKAALSVEAAIYNLCQTFGSFKAAKLTNILPPHSEITQCMCIESIERLMSSKPLSKDDFKIGGKVMLVNIPTTSIRAMITDEDSLIWIKQRSGVYTEEQKPTIVFSVVRGVIVGAYRVNGWIEEEYDKLNKTKGKRYIPDELICDIELRNSFYGSNVTAFLARTTHKRQYKFY